VDHYVEASKRLDHKKLTQSVLALRKDAAGGIGALLWGARRSAARRELRGLLSDVTRNDHAVRRHGLDVAREGPRFSHRRDSPTVISTDLQTVMNRARDEKDQSLVEAYLRSLAPGIRIELMAPAAKDLVALLGDECVATLVAEEGDVLLVDSLRFFLPILRPAVRREILRSAIDAQIEHGDETSTTTLFMCAPWMNIQETAEAFGRFFNAFGPLDPKNNLWCVIRPRGHIYWGVPLLRKLGGDEALVATGREIAGAVEKAERLCKTRPRRTKKRLRQGSR
jgi:hypothetical protein